MKLYAQEILNPSEWETWYQEQPHTLFTQSSDHGRFYETMGESSWIIGIYKDKKLIGGAVVVSVHAKRGNFLYIPYGPTFVSNHEQAFTTLTNFLKDLGRRERFHFIRVSPFIEDSAESRTLYRTQGYQPSPIHTLAEHTWLLHLDDSEENLLRAMNKNHRNLIRRCEREGVIIKKESNPASLEELNTLLTETAEKHRFYRFSKQFIDQEFLTFAHKNQALIFTATLPDGRIDAASIMMFYGTMACYRHSGSRNLDKRLPSSYLIQWEAIKEAKRRGMRWYNFWGIAPETAKPHHPFYGITHFKKGFGGQGMILLPCQDLPLTKHYWLTWGIETLRKIKRGF